MLTVAIDATDASGPVLRGWGRYARRLIEALPGAGVDVRAFRASGPLPEVWFEQVGLPRRARAVRADVVHAPSCFLPLRRRCAGVVTIHDLAFEEHPADFARRTRAKFAFFTPRAARSAERVICPSEFTAADVCRRYGVDRAKVRVIPEAPALPVGGEPPPPGRYVLGVGDLRAKKNWGVLVEAGRRLGVRVVIAGAGDGAGLEGAELAGYVSDARLDALMRGAAALVHPSLYEGFGLVLVEAMARGCPVLAADATALPETVGDAGVLFDPHDPDDLAEKLAAVLADPGDFPARGRARAARLSWERTARETAAVYAELA